MEVARLIGRPYREGFVKNRYVVPPQGLSGGSCNTFPIGARLIALIFFFFAAARATPRIAMSGSNASSLSFSRMCDLRPPTYP